MASTYPSQDHLDRLVKELVAVVDTAQANVSRHVVFLQGEHGLNRHDTDRELPFRQESNFHYLTGSLVASSTFVVDIPLNEGRPKTVSRKLFIPQETAEASLWSIPPPSLDVAAKQCGFERENMGYSDADDESHLKGLLANADKTTLVHVLSNKLLDPLYPHPSSWLTDLWDSKNEYAPFFTSEYLLKALHRARLIKTPQEIEYIREANRITSGAHEVVMRELGRFARRRDVNTVGSNGKVETTKRTGKEGLTQWEIESEADAEAVFVATCKRAGAGQAYLPIVASGSRASTLHYVCNDRLFPSTTNVSHTPTSGQFSTSAVNHDAAAPVDPSSQAASGRGCCGDVPSESFDDLHSGPFLPQVLLIDAGCEYKGGYASDVTRTVPVGNGGKFTDEGKTIYSIVLKMQKAAEAQCKAGVHWDDLHLLCHRTLCEEFLKLGIFKEASVDEIVAAGLTQAFYPHGLGHSLGLDVHDSLQLLRSEYLDLPETSKQFPHIFKYLRIRRPLEVNMVLTIEPGCYFAMQLMDEYKVRESPWVDLRKLAQYIPVGGVRIEDAVVVKEDRCENLTTAMREVGDVEAICSGRV